MAPILHEIQEREMTDIAESAPEVTCVLTPREMKVGPDPLIFALIFKG